ncbi:hypothetical protein MASR2M70_07300 [Bacillota bacterium]
MGKEGHKTQITPLYGYSILVAVIIELASLFIIGWTPQFLYGLALGTAVAIINYKLLVFSSTMVLKMGRGLSLAVLGYCARLAIYGLVFYMSYKIGTASGIATLLGYMTIKLAMFYVCGFKSGFKPRDYKGVNIRNLDQDQWAAEAAEKAARKKNPGKIAGIFRSDDDWQQWLKGNDSNEDKHHIIGSQDAGAKKVLKKRVKKPVRNVKKAPFDRDMRN